MSVSLSRRVAVDALLRIHEQDGYSHIVLEEVLQKSGLHGADRALAVRLVYGVIERRLTVDYLLNRLSKTPVVKMDPPVREILRSGVYQLLYLDKMPDFAVVNESVELVRCMGIGRLAGYVNGVLHSVIRSSAELLVALPSTDKGMEIRHSCPREWIRLWRREYGEEMMAGILDSLNEVPPAYVRINTCLTTVEAFTRKLTENGIGWETVPYLPAALRITDPFCMRRLDAGTQRLYYFQDIASQFCCQALGAMPGERIADVCAAPGGKSFTVALEMNGNGCVEAADLYEQKCALMRRRASDLGLTNITVHCRNAEEPWPAECVGSYDRVICDAPCSGLGVIRRKPEIRYKKESALSSLTQTQQRVLSNAALLVRPGGVLQYSTCTLRREENEQITAMFLAEHHDFLPRVLPLDPCFAAMGRMPTHEITLFPHVHRSDGFYIAGFVRV